MKQRTIAGVLLALALVGGGVASAKPTTTSNCLAATDAAHDEKPPPQAVGFDAGSLDVLSLKMSTTPKILRVVVTARSLREPIQPPGQNVSYRVFWTMDPPEQAQVRFSLDAVLDGDLASFTLGMSNVDTRSAATGDSYEQVGGPLSGTVDAAHAKVTVDVPRSLINQYTYGGGRFLKDITFSAWHGVGNPMLGLGGQVLVGSSGYRRIADSQETPRELDVYASRCRL